MPLVPAALIPHARRSIVSKVQPAWLRGNPLAANAVRSYHGLEDVAIVMLRHQPSNATTRDVSASALASAISRLEGRDSGTPRNGFGFPRAHSCCGGRRLPGG